MAYEEAQASLSDNSTNMDSKTLAEQAVTVATRQLMASTEFKKPRLTRLAKYWELYDGKIPKKLRQLFNVPIPVFPGMIDTLNAQYDTPIELKFQEGDPGDYFKVQKINGAFQMEVMNTAQNSKWDSKLRIARRQAIMNGRAILRYNVESDPEYKSDLGVTNLKNFHFQPKGGLWLENHLFAGEEDVQRTESELEAGAKSGCYDKTQVQTLLRISNDREYLPDASASIGEKLSRFKPLGLDPDNHSYVGERVFKLVEWVLELKGTRYYLCFDPWSKTWLRFDKWEDMTTSGLYPWESYATHEDDENFLSKSYGDDLYPAADAIVAMFNQELTNREKRNFGARAYDKDMFKDVRKLDEAMHRPDALVPADTQNGTRRIAEGIFEFKVGELNGTVNLIDWINGTIGRSTGATDLQMGDVTQVSKKASVTFAEQKSVSKRIGWGAQPFQEMMAGLGKRFVYGLKDHMPSKMAIRMMGERGWDWDQITRLDLDTTKDVDILISSTDQQQQESELKSQRRKDALLAIGADPLLAPVVNPKWRAREVLSALGEYDDAEVSEALDVKSNADKKSMAKAAEAIQLILEGKKPDLWFGATPAFMQKIVDFASDNRSTLKSKFDTLLSYAMAHTPIAQQNLQRKAQEDAQAMMAAQGGMQPPMDQQQPQQGGMPMGGAPQPQPQPSGIPPGVSHAMNMAQAGA